MFYVVLYYVFTLFFQVTDLRDKTRYEFRILAQNKMGLSSPSQPSEPVTAKDALSKLLNINFISFLVPPPPPNV